MWNVNVGWKKGHQHIIVLFDNIEGGVDLQDFLLPILLCENGSTWITPVSQSVSPRLPHFASVIT